MSRYYANTDEVMLDMGLQFALEDEMQHHANRSHLYTSIMFERQWDLDRNTGVVDTEDEVEDSYND
jgi:hypothetical protein